MTDAPQPVDDEVLKDLRQRLRAFRAPALPDVQGWGRGTCAGRLGELVVEWAERFDWRSHEARIRALPWVRAGGMRVIHQRAADAEAPVVVLLHGWPDSVLRFERVLPLLTDAHLVVPALPGYPFSSPAQGMATAEMGDAVARAMADLGYDRYVVSGGDIGSNVAEALAVRDRDRVAGLHLTDISSARVQAIEPRDLTGDEHAFVEQMSRWYASEGGYMHQQSTKPHTLAPALADSPSGLLAWMLEKLQAWTDDFETSFTDEEVLTWVTAYWVTNTIGSSFSPYVQPRLAPTRVDVPAVFTFFPKDLVPAPPRSLVERTFDVHGWDEPSRGGHFGAWEDPTVYAAGVRAALGLGA
ncbi:epoxide hydrolase [Phycicoccus sp. BSK3Z-2]|uniref:Epoxide hydrolase n=1 Tax=Phycicoccus avicenniae TaxID=2828860 RepID=A0A941D7R6_9MICO|nr:epoxide hydrolase family protein [Phycicoccus avicenniae]MBR7743350.1 epoxide hydrolase [Phycicoccus avicenniae]